MWAAFLTTILFSLSAVCGSRTTRLVGGTEANFWRLVFAAMVLGVYAHSFGAGLANVAFPMFLFSGCIGFGLGDAALFQALPRIGSRLSVMMVLCLSSPMAAGIEWFWMGTALSRAEMFAAVTTLAGVAMALAPGGRAVQRKGPRASGTAFGLAAAVCQAIGAVLSRRAFAVAGEAAENVDGITAAYMRIVGGIVVMAVLLLVVKGHAANAARSVDEAGAARNLEQRKASWRRAWPWVLANGLAGPALGVSCFQWALKTTPTGVVLPIVAITPIVIIPFARFIEGERPTRRSLAGGLLAVSGAVALAWVSSRAK